MNIATTPDQTAAHPVVHLKDYQPPAYAVDDVQLDIRIFADHAQVTSKLTMQRQSAGPLVLFGRELELIACRLDGEQLDASRYQLDGESLTLIGAPDRCVVETTVRIHPETNTELEGLYLAGAPDDFHLYVTQNEPEGFRKITFFPDRPDVLSVYTTRIEADARYPVLLANGNLVEQGGLDDGSGRHYAIWHDPTRKPSYLFACVAGDLAVMKDTYTTMEGRLVSLEIYTQARDLDKCHVAMQALKDSMRWDEQHYGRAYDLDNYMIVAVSQFNMGAMENKGLNLFNTACVLSDPHTTTDPANFYVKSTIAHEYFHNWTGNRITCRDWFQLCLKEGFTVYRDQCFSNTLQSPAVQRIDDVSSLKAIQFAEEAGPMSHPPRPDHFIEINNFYTATVYDKGAEIVRMMAEYLGPERYRQATDRYFADHDGHAVTVEDLLDSFSKGSGVDVWPFLRWYSQPGTPCVKARGQFNPDTGRYTLTLSQSTAKNPKYPDPQPLPIPVAVALFDPDRGALLREQMLLLDQAEQSFGFENIDSAPVLSLLRDFSAPVRLDVDYRDADLAFLMQHETNGFNQWQAAQLLLERILLDQHPADQWLDAMQSVLPQLAARDPLLASRLIEVPSENALASRIDRDHDPEVLGEHRDALLNKLAERLREFWPQAYAAVPIVPYEDSAEAMGRRAWRNAVLAMACRAGLPEALNWASRQYDQAVCMTERLGALRMLVWHDAPDRQARLDDFAQRFANEALAMDLWFAVQASNPVTTAAQARQLTEDPRFDWNTPNRIRSVTGQFASLPRSVWTPEGMQFYADLTERLDQKNAVLASRLLQVLARWYTLKAPLRSQAQAILQGLQGKVSSSSVTETLGNLLKAG